MEGLLEMTFRSFQDNTHFHANFDLNPASFWDHFRRFLGSQIASESGPERFSTSIPFSNRFWFLFKPILASEKLSFSGPGGGPCGRLPLPNFIRCHFLVFSVFDPLQASFWTPFGPFSGPFLDDFRASPGDLHFFCVYSIHVLTCLLFCMS